MSQFYDQSSLVFLPSGYKDGKLYSQKPLSTSGELAFSRGSDIEATRVNANGYIEKAQVNLLLQSNTFNTTWVLSNTTLTGGQTGYDGTSNAWLLEVSAGGTYRRISQNTNVNAVMTNSIYAKAGTVDFIAVTDTSGSTSNVVFFDLANGVIDSITNAGQIIDAQIESVGGGWYRCSAALTGNTSGTALWFVSATGGSNSNAGDNVYIQDAAQCYGLVAQTYQETTTAAVVSGITNDMPRLNYDPANPTCPSLLLEPSRTNVLTNSEYYGGYPQTRITLTQNAALSPEGVNNATKMVETTDTGLHFLSLNGSVTSSANVAFSIFAKQGENQFLQVLFGTSQTSPDAYANVDLSDGTYNDYNMVSFDTQDYGGGWYRIVGVVNSLVSTFGFYIASVQSKTAARAATYTGDGTSGFYLYGGQIESNCSYSSSYLPTYGTSATRTADACSKTGISSLIGQTEGTVFVEGESVTIDTSTNSPIYITVSNANQTDILYIQQMFNRTIRVDYFAGNVRQARITSTTTYPMGTKVKVAFGYKSGDFVVYINGEQIGTDTGTSMAPLSKVTIGAFEAPNFTGSAISQALLFKTRLSNADLATLTSL